MAIEKPPNVCGCCPAEEPECCTSKSVGFAFTMTIPAGPIPPSHSGTLYSTGSIGSCGFFDSSVSDDPDCFINGDSFAYWVNLEFVSDNLWFARWYIQTCDGQFLFERAGFGTSSNRCDPTGTYTDTGTGDTLAISA